MRLLDLKFHFLIISIVITSLPACTPKNNDHQVSLSGVPELISTSPIPSLQPVSSPGSLSENSALLQLKPKIEGTLAVDFDKGSANGCVS